MATATGMWTPFVIDIPSYQPPDPLPPFPLPPVKASARGSNKSKPQRNHHYTFDVDDNGLHINGFILHTDKHKGERHKFRVYLDSNENGRFDKSDPLIGMSGLKQKHAAKGVGNLLDEGEIGQLEVTFKKAESNASMRSLEAVDMDRGPLYQSSQSGGSLHMYEEMQFITSTGNDPVASVPVDNS